jgi:valyl-tRNA synthetase
MPDVNTTDIPSQYDPRAVEKKWYDFWQQHQIFTADNTSKRPKFSLILPPPNVTGVLHMGHALTCTLEDILVRWKRMQGYNTLWVPGTDHAGIATQMVVERNLMKEHKLSKHDLGREKFLEKVWEWKHQSQNTILGQMKLIGCSVDWTRLKFTLDESASRAVRECFVRLYRDNLIYREEAIIQWCPRCRTALSDLEVKFKEKAGKIWHLKYVLESDPNQSVVVATTRPETLLGDVAVAVHPEDARFTNFHGKKVRLPLMNRSIPIITDDYVDKEFGTGALKITPGHDPNDYLVGKRHGLATLTIFDESALLNEQGGPYRGLTREKAREKILEDLTSQGLLVKEENHVHNVGHCDRCDTIVEPRVSLQWFVKAEILAKEAIRVVEEKEIRILPEEWEKTYFEWMRNIRPWCISRQLWWGHRIPAWYCLKCGQINVATETPKACEKCQHPEFRQEDDVLDTWFSSGLWPLSTLGWPEDTADLRTFYPTDVMETGFDILFFWVARMVMLGLRMTGKIPFSTVYLHPMVRDEYGQKMSKTKGNVKDPLEIVERVGADALRFTLAAMAVHGRDVLLSDGRIEGYRNFVNKIWNAFRFVSLHFPETKQPNVDLTSEINQWIWSRLNEARKDVGQALEQFRFFDAANRLYRFVWTEYCDWFLEFIKSDLDRRKASRESTAWQVLEEALRLLHPLMPFLTEEIWQRLPLAKTQISIALAEYPKPVKEHEFVDAERRVNRLIVVVEAIRSKRGEKNISPSVSIDAILSASPSVLAELKPFGEFIQRLSKGAVTFVEEDPEVALYVPLIAADVKVFLLKTQLGEEDAVVLKRLEAEAQRLAEHVKNVNARLSNEAFTSKAPKEVIEGAKKQRDDLQKQLDAIRHQVQELTGTPKPK